MWYYIASYLDSAPPMGPGYKANAVSAKCDSRILSSPQSWQEMAICKSKWKNLSKCIAIARCKFVIKVNVGKMSTSKTSEHSSLLDCRDKGQCWKD